MEWKPTLQDTYGPNMKLWSNSTNGTEVQTNERTDERKDENYIPLGINAGGIKNERIITIFENFMTKFHKLPEQPSYV